MATVHVGCVTFTVGAAGVAGCGLMVKLAAAEVQPAPFLATKL
ncbi:hypothetical protein [Hymenobacter oligotrophus]|nr:hypothetical protein [Hymenobacter oligotrophus]